METCLQVPFSLGKELREFPIKCEDNRECEVGNVAYNLLTGKHLIF